MAWTMGWPVSPNLSFDEDDVSSMRIALSATLTNWSFVTTLLTISSLVMISTANKGDATRPPRSPTIVAVRSFDLRFIAALQGGPTSAEYLETVNLLRFPRVQ